MPEWFAPTVPARVKPIPWLSPEATAYLESLLTPEMTVLEHGAGGSTLWFAERVKHVTAVESDLDWFNVLRKRVPENAAIVVMQGVLHIAPVDLLFIDGEPVETRAQWLGAAAQLVKPGGYVVLDNSNRPEYKQAREKFRETFTHIHTVDGNKGGCIHLITEFYRL